MPGNRGLMGPRAISLWIFNPQKPTCSKVYSGKHIKFLYNLMFYARPVLSNFKTNNERFSLDFIQINIGSISGGNEQAKSRLQLVML